MRRARPIYVLIAVVVFALVANTSHAVLVSIDTSALTPGTYNFYFTFTDGDDPTDAGNNTATITGFSLGGGSFGLADPGNNGYAGTINTTLTLTDSSSQYYLQEFNPGSTLSFDVALTGNVDSGDPDAFAFRLLDNLFNPLPTTAYDGLGTIAYAEINSPTPSVQSYQLSSFAVPEPSMVFLFLTGIVVITSYRRAKAQVLA